jgi:hypothetical protein
MVELGSRCATERAQIGNSPPKVARACALLDEPNLALQRVRGITLLTHPLRKRGDMGCEWAFQWPR